MKGNPASRFVAHTAEQNAFEGGAETVKTNLVLDDGSTLNEIVWRRNLPVPSRSYIQFLALNDGGIVKS